MHGTGWCAFSELFGCQNWGWESQCFDTSSIPIFKRRTRHSTQHSPLLLCQSIVESVGLSLNPCPLIMRLLGVHRQLNQPLVARVTQSSRQLVQLVPQDPLRVDVGLWRAQDMGEELVDKGLCNAFYLLDVHKGSVKLRRRVLR